MKGQQMKNCKPILLVEDDDVDALTVRRAFKELKVTNPLVRAGNGEEALKYLEEHGNECQPSANNSLLYRFFLLNNKFIWF